MVKTEQNQKIEKFEICTVNYKNHYQQRLITYAKLQSSSGHCKNWSREKLNFPSCRPCRSRARIVDPFMVTVLSTDTKLPCDLCVNWFYGWCEYFFPVQIAVVMLFAPYLSIAEEWNLPHKRIEKNQFAELDSINTKILQGWTIFEAFTNDTALSDKFLLKAAVSIVPPIWCFSHLSLLKGVCLCVDVMRFYLHMECQRMKYEA